MSEYAASQAPNQNRVPPEHIKFMSLWALYGGDSVLSRQFAESLRHVDYQCFGAEMAYEQEFLRERVVENHGNIWCAVNLFPEHGTPFDSGNIVGYILSSRGHESGSFAVPNNAGYIDSLAVLPEAQGLGIGRRLRELTFEYWLDTFKLETVHTLARPDNEPMIKLNKRMGLVAVRDLEPGLYTDGKPRTEFVLTQQAWEGYKEQHPERDWNPKVGQSADPRFNYRVIRRKFDP